MCCLCVPQLDPVISRRYSSAVHYRRYVFVFMRIVTTTRQPFQKIFRLLRDRQTSLTKFVRRQDNTNLSHNIHIETFAASHLDTTPSYDLIHDTMAQNASTLLTLTRAAKRRKLEVERLNLFSKPDIIVSSSQQSTNFLSLPFEIRSMIYDFLGDDPDFGLSFERRESENLAVDRIVNHHNKLWPYHVVAPKLFPLMQASRAIRKEVGELLLEKTVLHMKALPHVDHLFALQRMPEWLRKGATKIMLYDELDSLRLRAHGRSFPFDLLTGIQQVGVNIPRRERGEREPFPGLWFLAKDKTARDELFAEIERLARLKTPVHRLNKVLHLDGWEFSCLRDELKDIVNKMIAAMEVKTVKQLPFEILVCNVPMTIKTSDTPRGEAGEELRLQVDCLKKVILGVRWGTR